MVKEFELTVEIRQYYQKLKPIKEAITLFHGSKQPHEINIWKNNVSKSKLEIRNEIVLELKPLINNECLLTSISNNKH